MEQRIGKQGGYVGIVVLLIAVLIVAWLSKDALKAYLSPAQTIVPGRTATPAERARAPGAVESAGSTVDSATPVPTAPMERARDVAKMLKQEESRRDGGN